MQPSPRSDVFVRHLVAAATVRPMLNLLLAMKQGRVSVASPAVPAPMPEPAFPMMHPQAA
jgi:hypothetical protein